jgi:hypothetical protein
MPGARGCNPRRALSYGHVHGRQAAMVTEGQCGVGEGEGPATGQLPRLGVHPPCRVVEGFAFVRGRGQRKG